MLDAVEVGAKANKDAIDRAACALEAASAQASEATEALGKATEAMGAHGSRLEEMMALKMGLEQVQVGLKELQEESKASKVGKGDLIWKVLVGAFALIASGLGGTLISILIK